MSRKTIAVDWDGTLVEYHGWSGVGEYGAPIPLMVMRIQNWLKQGHEVLIFTARVSPEHDPQNIEKELAAISTYLLQMNLPILEVTANKYIRISEFWDDRGVGVERNTGICREDLGTL